MSVALVLSCLGTVVWESGAQSSVRAGRLENACFFLSLSFTFPRAEDGGTIRDMGEARIEMSASRSQ